MCALRPEGIALGRALFGHTYDEINQSLRSFPLQGKSPRVHRVLGHAVLHLVDGKSVEGRTQRCWILAIHRARIQNSGRSTIRRPRRLGDFPKRLYNAARQQGIAIEARLQVGKQRASLTRGGRTGLHHTTTPAPTDSMISSVRVT